PKANRLAIAERKALTLALDRSILARGCIEQPADIERGAAALERIGAAIGKPLFRLVGDRRQDHVVGAQLDVVNADVERTRVDRGRKLNLCDVVENRRLSFAPTCLRQTADWQRDLRPTSGRYELLLEVVVIADRLLYRRN